MVEKGTTIGPQEGLHARPAAQFVKTAKGFSSEIMIVKGDKEANEELDEDHDPRGQEG
jgi:phosphocarrier protein HPr